MEGKRKTNCGEQQRRKMEEWKKFGKMSRQNLEMESAGLFHGGHVLRNGGTGIDLTLYLIHKL